MQPTITDTKMINALEILMVYIGKMQVFKEMEHAKNSDASKKQEIDAYYAGAQHALKWCQNEVMKLKIALNPSMYEKP